MVEITAPDGTALSALCFGCMQFGGTADEVASQEMYEACRAKGVTFFDTAHLYTDGKSEKFLGRFAKDARDSLIIATKAAYSGGSGRANILSNFDESRARLGFDSVEILYLHQWDDHTPLEESFETLAELQQAGKIGHIGVSNFAAWQVMKAQAVAAKLGTRIDILQPMYSLVKRQAEVEILPMALSEGIAVAPYSPLGGGLLTGKYVQGGSDAGSGRLATNERYATRYGQEWMHRTAADLTKLAGEMGHDPATLAVAWAAHNPGVTAPIISARSAAQLAPSLAAMDVTLNDADYARIEALSQRPAPATDRLEETAG
jgi:aryl-alcohol dehydrogenase-like predicted oxidoreductase